MQTLKDSIKTIIVSLIVFSAVSIVYAWTEPASNPPSGNASAPITTGGSQIKSGGLGVASLDVAGGATFGSNLSVAGNITSGGQSVCRQDGTNCPPSGITSESDPTVPASVKDGIAWSEISSRPAGLDDGDQNSFGGMYRTNWDGSCRLVNPMTESCGCPAGFSASNIVISGDRVVADIIWCYK